MAVKAFKANEVSKIILTRPAVEQVKAWALPGFATKGRPLFASAL